MSQDEARFPLVPTLRTTLGVKGHRPVVGTWDNKDLVYSFAAMNVVTGQLTTRLVESPAKAKRRTGLAKTVRLQHAFAAHLADLQGYLASFSISDENPTMSAEPDQLAHREHSALRRSAI